MTSISSFFICAGSVWQHPKTREKMLDLNELPPDLNELPHDMDQQQPSIQQGNGQKMVDLFTTRRQVMMVTLWAMTMWQGSHQPVVSL